MRYIYDIYNNRIFRRKVVKKDIVHNRLCLGENPRYFSNWIYADCLDLESGGCYFSSRKLAVKEARKSLFKDLKNLIEEEVGIKKAKKEVIAALKRLK